MRAAVRAVTESVVGARVTVRAAAERGVARAVADWAAAAAMVEVVSLQRRSGLRFRARARTRARARARARVRVRARARAKVSLTAAPTFLSSAAAPGVSGTPLTAEVCLGWELGYRGGLKKGWG